MAATDDPLLLLRHAISTRSDIRLLSSDQSTQVYSLSSASFLSLPSPASTRLILPKAIPTRYRRPEYGVNDDVDPKNEADKQAFYDLQSLLCCYLNRDKPSGAYIGDATSQGCAWVSVTERKVLEDFLEGKSPEPALVKPLSAAEGAAAIRSTTPTDEPTAPAPAALAHAAPTAPTAPPAKRQRYVPNKSDQQAVRAILSLHEPPHRQISDRRSALRGDKLVDYGNVRGLMEGRLKAVREEVLGRRGGRGGSGRSAPAPVETSSSSRQGKKRPLNPIIIISPSSSAMLTMANIKRFLEDAVFESPQGGPGRATEDVVPVLHRRGASSLTAPPTNPSAPSTPGSTTSSSSNQPVARYFVVDGVEALSKFGEDAWDRVVCVMTTGQEWQFRPYKWKDPKQLFHHVKGFFIQWTHDPPNPKVRAWNVTELRLDQSKRHIDKSVAADFWRNLEAWIALNKPYLAY